MQKSTVAFISVTSVAALSWLAMITAVWMPFSVAAMGAVRVTAATSAVALMLLLSLRWLRAQMLAQRMTYLLDAMLTQRDEARRKPPTEPLRVVR